MSINQPLNDTQFPYKGQTISVANKIQNFKNQTIMTPNSSYKFTSFIPEGFRDFAMLNIHRSSFIILILCALCYFPVSLAGQSCGNSITLRSQAAIDNFTTTYGSCRTISTLRLEGNDITNIDGLSNIRTINNLFAQQVPNLENFDGFSNLNAVNNLLIRGCPKVTNLDGFSSLTKIKAELRLSNMANLTSIEGLRNVIRMPRFRIWQNPKLETCCLLYRFANNPATIVKVMYGNAGNCSIVRILAHPNTSTIALTESAGTAISDMVCKGSTAEMTASGAFDFTWNTDASLSATDISNPMVTPMNETIYTVTARGCNNTVDTESFTVKISEPATIAEAGPNQVKLSTRDFTLVGNTPTVGTGKWTLVSGTANITSPANPQSSVTGVPYETSVTLKWTITNGACYNSDEVVLKATEKDDDDDGTPNDLDTCDDRIDTDGDGISDCKDTCDDRIDTDGDGIVDCFDFCDDRIDTDGDGTSDCKDNCPNDPTKIEPDACGCGTPPQIDSDGDGIVNCMDECPYDLNQYVDGQLECGRTIKSDTRLGDRVIVDYGECTDFDYIGRELFYKLTLYDAGTMTVRFKEIGNGSNELQLMILNDYCFIDSCLGTIVGNPGTEEALVLEDVPAGDYYFAVDSRGFYDRAEFELTVDCGVGGSSMVTCLEDALLTEDFEGYVAGTDIVAASANFELSGETSTSAKVTTTHDEIPNQALYLNRSKGISDINFVLGNQQRGIGRVAFNIYVEPRSGATFNIYGHKSTPSFGAKYQIDTDDTALQGKWMSVEAYFDVENDSYTLFIDNRAIVVSGNYLPGLGRINFYAYWNNAFYIDNLCYSEVASIPAVGRVTKVENELLQNIVKPTATTTTTATSENFTTDVTTTAAPIKQDLKVYPNPTTGAFRYEGQLSTMEDITIEIFNQLGQSVRRAVIADASVIDVELELNNLPEGIYLLQAYSDKLLDTQRIVLQR